MLLLFLLCKNDEPHTIFSYLGTLRKEINFFFLVLLTCLGPAHSGPIRFGHIYFIYVGTLSLSSDTPEKGIRCPLHMVVSHHVVAGN